MAILENILTLEEVEELSGQDGSPKLTRFESFSGRDGDLYFGRGLTLSPEDYQVIAASVFAAPKGTSTEILARAIERRIREGSANAYVLQYELSIDQRFSLTEYKDYGVENSNIFSIFSVVYVKADEEKLKELNES